MGEVKIIKSTPRFKFIKLSTTVTGVVRRSVGWSVGRGLSRLVCLVLALQVVRWLVSSSEECRGDRASAVRLGQDMVSNRLLTPLCAGYDEHLAGTRDASAASKQSKQRERDLPRSFDDGVGWLFAYAGEALRDPSAPPPPPEVSVMRGSRLCVSVAEWIEVLLSFLRDVRFALCVLPTVYSIPLAQKYHASSLR